MAGRQTAVTGTAGGTSGSRNPARRCLPWDARSPLCPRGRWAERAQVAEDEVVDGGRGGERTPEPRLGRRHRDLMRAAEEASRWNLHKGEVVPARVRERRRVVRGEALAQRCAERGEGERLVAQQRPGPLEDRTEIDAGEGRPHLGMRGQLPVEDGPRIEAIRTTRRSRS